MDTSTDHQFYQFSNLSNHSPAEPRQKGTRSCCKSPFFYRYLCTYDANLCTVLLVNCERILLNTGRSPVLNSVDYEQQLIHI